MTQKLKALSSEGGPATGWKNKIRGSILAYTLIVLTIMLMTALSVASVTILDKKNAQSTAGSTQAFANADSGSEILLGYRYRDDQQSLNTLATSRDNGSCTNGVVTFDLSGGTVTLTTYSDTEGNSPIDSCAATLATVQKVKSVGSFSGSSRAVEVAVAASSDNNGNHCDNLKISDEQGAPGVRFASAINGCRSLNDNEVGGATNYQDWYLPTAEELACFIGVSGVTGNSWARTPDYSSTGSDWMVIGLTDGSWREDSDYSDPFTFRCVR